MNKERILGFDVSTYNSKELIDNIFEDYLKKEQLFIVNINPEIIVSNYKDRKMKQIFNEQKYQIPDGSGIVWASNKLQGNIKERITGIDLMLKICEKSIQYSSKVYLYGGKDGIAEKAKQELEKQFKGIQIIGVSSGYKEQQEVLNELKKLPIDILFVGIGSPKQEEFIIEHREELKNVKILMPVGGSFDVISKLKRRAPNCIQRLNLEWLYRLLQEPKRIFRQLKLVKFIFLIKKYKKGK